ncbi:MAG: HDOD domain-containing protein [Bacteroidota bacterium]
MPSDSFVPATRFEKEIDLELRFPPLPRTITEVAKLQSKGVPDTKLLGEIVHADPVIGASVLRRINSAYYGLSRRVGDVKRAVRLLGFNEVCNIVTTAGMVSLKDAIGTDEQATIFTNLMRLSIGAAYIAEVLHDELQLPSALTFTTALLHPVGRLTLLFNRPDDYEALWYTSDTGTVPTSANEKAIFGMDHAEAGGLTCEKWELPSEMSTAIRHYLAPTMVEDMADEILALTIAVSSHAAIQLGLHSGDQTDEPYVPTTHARRLLDTLAKMRPKAEAFTTDDVTYLIEQQRAKALAYVDAMAVA